MIVNIIKIILFSFIINWCMSLQIFQQSLSSNKRRDRFISVILAMVAGSIAGLILIW